VIDVVAMIGALAALWIGGQPADANHPYSQPSPRRSRAPCRCCDHVLQQSELRPDAPLCCWSAAPGLVEDGDHRLSQPPNLALLRETVSPLLG
jgi:hypothetical protein